MIIMSLQVKCLRCGKIHTARQGDSEVECDCHLYCDYGDKPQDCTMIAVNFEGALNYPRGMHTNSDSVVDADRPKHQQFKCTVHGRYSEKTSILIPVDWTKADRRASSSLRYFGKGTF
jgi:hypothetical protein